MAQSQLLEHMRILRIQLEQFLKDLPGPREIAGLHQSPRGPSTSAPIPWAPPTPAQRPPPDPAARTSAKFRGQPARRSRTRHRAGARIEVDPGSSIRRIPRVASWGQEPAALGAEGGGARSMPLREVPRPAVKPRKSPPRPGVAGCAVV